MLFESEAFFFFFFASSWRNFYIDEDNNQYIRRLRVKNIYIL